MAEAVAQTSERFIPVRYRELASALGDRFFTDAEVRRQFSRVSRLIEAVVEAEARAFEHLIAEQYAIFNPDRDTVSRVTAGEADSLSAGETYRRLNRWLHYCFDKANFDLIDEAEFRRALDVANTQGLRIKLDQDRVEDLMLFCRGRTTTQRQRHTWRHPIKPITETIAIYRRYATVVKLAGEPVVQLKLFKDIPQIDLEALMPHATVQMTRLDQMRIGASGATALGSALLKVLTLSWKAAAVKLLWVLMVGAVGLLFRTFFGYRNLRELRTGTMARNLYFQNLDNNSGVIHALLDMITQEEAEEALLGYAFFLPNDGPRAHTPEQLKDLAESYLSEAFGVRVGLDLDDAMETVTRLGLWHDRGRCEVVGLCQARGILSRYLSAPNCANYHQRMADAVPQEAHLMSTQADGNERQ